MDIYERLLLPENLYYAWRKARMLYRMADSYVDNGELAEFELDLEYRLSQIHRHFKEGSYRTGLLRPLPCPKKLDGENPVDRQYYHVSVDDQVAWLAVVNALGPELDQIMPAWSYGSRLYRPAWYEKDEERISNLEVGPYRHSSGHLYRKFQHSWPLFRRHIALTARKMVKAMPMMEEELDQGDRMAVAVAEKEGLGYLDQGFWSHDNGKSSDQAIPLYYGSIDLKQFFPSIRPESILNALASINSEDTKLIRDLLTEMLYFKLDTSYVLEKNLDCVEPKFSPGVQEGIPTGLFVSGFLANVALLNVDEKVHERIIRERTVAHFRYVDDHTFLAYDFGELCEWIRWYLCLLRQCGTGVSANTEKTDPPELGEWLFKNSTDYERAKSQCLVDGRNPTKLLTKTLAQVSAVAATNINVMDDDDLQEQLKLAEWLMLADIPEREIRSGTRAAFAAGRIARLVPHIAQEPDGLIDFHRRHAENSSSPEHASKQHSDIDHSDPHLESPQIEQLESEYERKTERTTTHYFNLLMAALDAHPGRIRLFHRVLDFCRLTGHKGLSSLVDRVQTMRNEGREVWGDFFAGLALQRASRGALLTTRVLLADDVLRSEQIAARSHLEDICRMRLDDLEVQRDREAWFHAMSRREFGVAMQAVSATFHNIAEFINLASEADKLARQCIPSSTDDSNGAWRECPVRAPGVWAHFVESFLAREDSPSQAWKYFWSTSSAFAAIEYKAMRRYPQNIPDVWWSQMCSSPTNFKLGDSGWIREAIGDHPQRILAAKNAGSLALKRAARSLVRTCVNYITLLEWADFLSEECSAFDPRRSEWTALEITRRIVLLLDKADMPNKGIPDRLHPANVMLPRAWRTIYEDSKDDSCMSWEEWRKTLGNGNINSSVKFRTAEDSVVDYRYSSNAGETNLTLWQRTLIGIGRLLLGQLRQDYDCLGIWNIRGNERAIGLPLAKWLRSVAISSRTSLLLESCLSGRSAETRLVYQSPRFFGVEEGDDPNDVNFDPPLLRNSDELLKTIKQALQILESNQLSVLMNQPRQLIPFRVQDFAAGLSKDDEDAEEVIE